MQKKVLIYGISGQDGYYLAKLLQSKGYVVHGISQNKPVGLPDVGFTQADLSGVEAAYLAPMEKFAPDEVCYLAGINSHQKVVENPALAFRVNAVAPIAIMQRLASSGSRARFFHASSAYIFGERQGKVSESSGHAPDSAYGISKLSAHLMAAQFRKEGLFACNGILFNHESQRRPVDFVTRKITRAAAAASLGMQKEKLVLGNLDASRDWGYAGDYVEAMWLMLQQKTPDDFIIATGEPHTVREFCQEAFSHAGLDWERHVQSDPRLFRKSEQTICADISKAKAMLGWTPKVKFKEIVRMMVDADMENLGNGGAMP